MGESWIDFEKRVKSVTRPCVPGDETSALAVTLGYSYMTRIANCLEHERPDYLSVGRWWKLQEALDDYRPAMAMMADAGFFSGRLHDEQPGDVEKALVVAVGRLITALNDARAPESEGGEEITPNEMRMIRPLAMDIQQLAGQVALPAAARYSLGGLNRGLINRLLGGK